MWKLALEEFIKGYKDNPEVEAILLVGSYAVGNQNDKSDIDVYVILNDEAMWRERGNKLVKGYLIEYFINPVRLVREYILEDKRGHGGAMANMLMNGQVLLDRHGIVDELKKEAIAAIQVQEYERNPMRYYACWCAFDEYEAAEYHNEMQYYICLKYLVEAYLANNGYCVLPDQKIEKFFKNDEYRMRYNIGRFPNNEFNELVIKCFDEPNHDNLKALYDYVINDGCFDINNFVYRNELK
jgi:predicted nucleotidyltransferase